MYHYENESLSSRNLGFILTYILRFLFSNNEAYVIKHLFSYSVNTYEKFEKKSEAHAYSSLDKIESGEKISALKIRPFCTPKCYMFVFLSFLMKVLGNE